MSDVAARQERLRQVLRGERPDRLPCGDLAFVEYRPDVYHLGDDEPLPPPGQVGQTRDGRRKVTRDGGVWAVDAREKYRTHEDVLAVDPSLFDVETVGPAMIETMARLLAARSQTAYAAPLHYGTLVTRATIEFGWEPFLCAAALEPERFATILDRFGAASLAVIEGWCRTPGVELLAVHDDIASTRGPILSPTWLRQYAFPWYQRFFAAAHAAGRQVLYMTDGNYLPVLDDLLALEPDGLYCESSAMDPAELLRRAGPRRIVLLKTNNATMDHGTPAAVREELRRLRELHQHYPRLLMYAGGGGLSRANREAFAAAWRELLVYG